MGNGMPVGVSGQAPLGVLVNWTNGVATDLRTLDVDPTPLWVGSNRAVDDVSATHADVRAEFERRLAVLERVIDEQRL